MFIAAVFEIRKNCDHSTYNEPEFERDLSSRQKRVERVQCVFGRYHTQRVLRRMYSRNTLKCTLDTAQCIFSLMRR